MNTYEANEGCLYLKRRLRGPPLGSLPHPSNMHLRKSLGKSLYISIQKDVTDGKEVSAAFDDLLFLIGKAAQDAFRESVQNTLGIISVHYKMDSMLRIAMDHECGQGNIP